MSQVPYSTEIANLRPIVEAGNEAMRHHQKLRLDKVSLELLMERPPATLPCPCPGDNLEAVSSVQAHTVSAELKRRLLAVEDAIQSAQHIIDRGSHAHAQLHELSHKQAHALDAPQFQDLRQALEALHQRRHDLERELAPATERVALLSPIQKQLQVARDTLTHAFHETHGLEQYRQRCLANAHLHAAHSIAQTLGLAISLPSIRDVQPDEQPTQEADNDHQRDHDDAIKGLADLIVDAARTKEQVSQQLLDIKYSIREILG